MPIRGKRTKGITGGREALEKKNGGRRKKKKGRLPIPKEKREAQTSHRIRNSQTRRGGLRMRGDEKKEKKSAGVLERNELSGEINVQ